MQTNKKHFKIAIRFLTGYKGIFNVTNSNIKFYFKELITDEDFIQITFPHGAYKLESLNNELKRIIIDTTYYNENENSFTIKPNFPTLGSIIQKLPQGPINGFVFNNNIGSLLGFHETILWQENNLSPNPVDHLYHLIIFLLNMILLME